MATKRDLLATGLLALLLALGFLSYAGYPLRDFNRALIGSDFDIFFNTWTMHQVFDNLLHRPTDLNHSLIFAGEEATFAYTIAPYGLALPLLPVYVLSGENLEFTLNLYWLLTFPLTACLGYLLVRYLTGAAALVCMVIGLWLAFAPFRFNHFSRIEMFSTHWLLLCVYCCHRYVDAPSLHRGVIWGMVLGMTAISSGYLMVFALTICAAILLYGLLLKPALLDNPALGYLAAASGIFVLIFIPFFMFRLDNASFRAGQAFIDIQVNGATVQDWFRSHSALYHTLMPWRGEWNLFIGLIPLSLLATALYYRREMITSIGTFQGRHLFYLYLGILIGGYLLTLGPVIAISKGLKIPSPYLIWMQLPGASNVRFPGRFIALPYVALAILAGLVLHHLDSRLPRRVGLPLLLAGLVICTAEILPHHADLIKPKYYEETDLRGWLRDLPDHVTVMNYPYRTDPLGAALERDFIYLHHYPHRMMNGWGSYFPAWYLTYDWSQFPDAATVQFVRDHDVRYVLVYQDMLSPAEREHISSSPLLTYQMSFGTVDIYTLTDRPS